MKQKEAEYFAEMAHSEIRQKRKYTHEPYINHPRNVAYLMKIIGESDEVISAAFLHDVLEDVAPHHPLFDEDNMRIKFGNEITDLVKWVTREKNCSHEAYLQQLASAPMEAHNIKIGDIIDNIYTIAERDPEFAQIYLPKKRETLNVLGISNCELYDIADRLLYINGY